MTNGGLRSGGRILEITQAYYTFLTVPGENETERNTEVWIVSALLVAAAVMVAFVFGFMCGAQEMHRKIKISLDEHRQSKKHKDPLR